MNLSKEIPKILPIFMVVKDENSQYNMLYRSPQHIYIYACRRRYNCFVYIYTHTSSSPLFNNYQLKSRKNDPRQPLPSSWQLSFSLQEREEKLAAEKHSAARGAFGRFFFIFSVRIIGCFQKKGTPKWMVYKGKPY